MNVEPQAAGYMDIQLNGQGAPRYSSETPTSHTNLNPTAVYDNTANPRYSSETPTSHTNLIPTAVHDNTANPRYSSETPTSHTNLIYDIPTNLRYSSETPTLHTNLIHDITVKLRYSSETPTSHTNLIYDIPANLRYSSETPTSHTNLIPTAVYDNTANPRYSSETPTSHTNTILAAVHDNTANPRYSTETPTSHTNLIYDIPANLRYSSETLTSHTNLILAAVQDITANQETVFRGFLDVVHDHNRKKSKKKTILRYLWYVLVYLVLLLVAICLYFVFPDPHIFLGLGGLEAILLCLIALVVIILGLYARIINRRLRNAARYLEVCQVSEELTKLMLPTFSPEVQQVCHCQLAGSSGDSFGFFPSFSANVYCCRLCPSPFTQDVDMNLFYNALVLSEQNLVDIGQPGFCWVQVGQGELLAGTGETFIHDCLIQHSQIPGRYYLSGKLVSDKIGSFIPTDRCNVSYNHPAITYNTTIKGPQGNFHFDVDVVFGIKLSVWPQDARAWPDRVRDNLPANVVQAVQALGCYIVHKHCSGTDFNMDHLNHDLDWRITFAEAESLLFKHHASKEALKLCYVIVKFVLKRYITSSKKCFPALKSYHLKTVFLWLAEEGHPTYDMVDVKNNANLANLFHLLFERYRGFLEKGTLPHYFMPSVNVIALCSQEELAAGVDVLKLLSRRPIYNIQSFDHAWISQKKLFLALLSVAIIYGILD